MRLAISQRVDVIGNYGERRDALDQAWYDLLAQLPVTLLPVPNASTPIDSWLANLEPEGVLLTGGNDLAQLSEGSNKAPERDATEQALLAYAHRHKLPVLGVCRGAQFMNQFLGGSIVQVDNHIAVRHRVESVDPNSDLFSGVTEVNSFHGWGIAPDGLASQCITCVLSEDSTVEAFRHKTLPWVGMLWHPEREPTPYSASDRKVLRHLFEVQS